MPSKKRKQIDQAVEWATAETCRLLDLFGERRYSFTVSYDKELEDIAKVYTAKNRYDFFMEVGPGFVKESEQDRKDTILHEVLHVLQNGWFHLVRRNLAQSSLPDGELKLFQSVFDSEMELYTDHLAGTLAGKI